MERFKDMTPQDNEKDMLDAIVEIQLSEDIDIRLIIFKIVISHCLILVMICSLLVPVILNWLHFKFPTGW